MMAFTTLVGLGIADALNPFSIAAMAFLLATDRPVQRGTIFIIGTLLVYLPGGFALMQGWSAILADVAPRLPLWVSAALHGVAGLVCLAFAAQLWSRSRGGDATPVASPSNLSLPATLVFAIVSTLSDLPTALPYFAAVDIAASLGGNLFGSIGLLVFYNLVYVSPLVAMLIIRMVAADRADRHLAVVRQAVDWSFSRLLPPMIAALGLFALVRGVLIAAGPS